MQKATDFQHLSNNTNNTNDNSNNNTSSRNRLSKSSSTQSVPPVVQGNANVSSSRLQLLGSENDQQTCTSAHISMIRTETNQNSSGVQVVKVSNCQPSKQQQQQYDNTSTGGAPERPTDYHYGDGNQNQHQNPNDHANVNEDTEKFVDALETPRDNNAPLTRSGEPHDSFHDQKTRSLTFNTEQSSHSLPQLSSEVLPQVKPRRKPKPGFPIPDVVERDDTPVTVYHCDPTTQLGPSYTFVTRSSVGVTNVIKFALREGFSIIHDETPHRCDHPPSPAAATTDEEQKAGDANNVDHNSDRYVRIRLSKRGEFKQIELIRVIPTSTDANNSSSLLSPNLSHSIPSSSLFSTAHVRIGATVSAAQVRAWCARSGEHGWNVKFDDDDSDTLDIRSVVAVEMINCGAEFQTVRDRALVTAAADCFGCLGVVTARIVEARRVRHAVVMPEKPLLLFDAVPPYRKTDVSPNVIGRFQENNVTNNNNADDVAQFTAAVDYNNNDGVHTEMQREEERELEFMRFYVRCKRDFAQFTWIPFQKQCWVHCWDATTDQIISSSHEINEHDNVDEHDISYNRIGGEGDGNHEDGDGDGENGMKRKDDKNKQRHRSSDNGPNELQLTSNYLLDDGDTYDDDCDNDDDNTCLYRSSTALLHDELREGGRRHRALVRFMNDCERQGLLGAREAMEICGHSALSSLPSGDVVRSNDQDAAYLWRVALGRCPWHRIEREDEPQSVREARDGHDGDADGDRYSYGDKGELGGESNIVDVMPPPSGDGLDTGIEYNHDVTAAANTDDGNRKNDKSRNRNRNGSDANHANFDEADWENGDDNDSKDLASGYKTCVLDIEIAGNIDGTPDYSVCQRAWWIAINAVYDALPGLPLRTSVQMRITKPVIATSFATPSVTLTIPSSPSAVSPATSSHHSHHRLLGVAPPEALAHQHYNNNQIPMLTTTSITMMTSPRNDYHHHPVTTTGDAGGGENTSATYEQGGNTQNSSSNTPKALRPHLFNPFGTCSLILTTTATAPDVDWEAYLRHVVDACVCLTHPITGRPLHVRPRPMAKWPREVQGVAADAFLRAECKREVIALKKTLAAVCVDAGYNLSESLSLFGTPNVHDFLREGSATRSQQ